MITKIRQNPFFARLFHTLPYCLYRELENCKTVLDLGCGPSSPIQYCRGLRFTVGVEAFKPYLQKAKEKKTHSKYIEKKIEEITFPAGAFDAVVLIEVLEHLPKKIGLEMLKKAEKWAKKKIIVSSPNGFLLQKAVDNNIYQRHLSGWDWRTMRKMGFKIRGLAGLKFLRKEVENETMGDDLTTSIKFRPKFFWFVIASLSQIFCYYFPRYAFEVFSVKLKEA